MTYTPTRETLELAALAGGVKGEIVDVLNDWYFRAESKSPNQRVWQPHLQTTQGKADLLDLIEGLKIDLRFYREEGLVSAAAFCNEIDDWVDSGEVASPSKAALEVAALVGAKMKGGV